MVPRPQILAPVRCPLPLILPALGSSEAGLPIHQVAVLVLRLGLLASTLLAIVMARWRPAGAEGWRGLRIAVQLVEHRDETVEGAGNLLATLSALDQLDGARLS